LTVKISGGGELNGAVLQNAATAELQNAIVRALGDNTTATRQANRTQRGKDDASTKAFGAMGALSKGVLGSSQTAFEIISRSGGALITGENSIRDFTDIFGKSIGNFNSGISGLDTAFGALGGGVQNISGFILDTNDTFNDMSVVGAGLEADFIELRRTAANTRLPLDQFAGIITANSEKLVALGGTVDRGSQVLAGFSQQLFDNRAGAELLQLGIGFEETNEYLMDYLSTQRRNDVFMNMSAQEQIKQTQKYVYELDTLARLTGKNRKEIQQEARDRAREGQNQAAIRLMEAKGIKGAQAEFESVSKHLSSKLGPSIADTFATMVRLDGAIDATDETQRGFAANFGKTKDLLSEAARAFKAGDFKRSEKLREQAEAQYFKRMGSVEFNQIAQLGGMAGTTGTVAAQLLGESQDMLDSVNGQKKALEASGKSAATHADALRAATEKVRQAQGRTGEAEIKGAITMTETFLKDASAALNNTLATTLKPEIQDVFLDIKKFMAQQSLSDIQGTFDKIAGNIGGYQAFADDLKNLLKRDDISGENKAKIRKTQKDLEERRAILRDNAATEQDKAAASSRSCDSATHGTWNG